MELWAKPAFRIESAIASNWFSFFKNLEYLTSQMSLHLL